METWSVIMPPEGSMEMPMVDVSGITRQTLDIPYASQSPNQKLDIYLPPDGDGPFPTIIFIHGGAFILGDKRDAQLLQVLDGINRGYAVVSVEHRLAYEAQFPAALFDVKSAIRFLRANAALLKLDGGRFALYGDSAGGHYVIMAAATQWTPAFEDFSTGNAAYSSAVQAVATRFGLYDFKVQSDMALKEPPEADPNFAVIEMALFGALGKDIGGLLYFTNALNFITKDFPPVFIQHGSHDKTVPVVHSYQLEEKVRTICGPERAEMHIMQGYDHGGIDPQWNAPENDALVFAFFEKHLK
jgi:acetyl esterase/lipase